MILYYAVHNLNNSIQHLLKHDLLTLVILLLLLFIVGSIERVTQPMWVLQDESIISKEITYTPGLYKIYDEILVNAADNKQRDPSMDKLDINIDPTQNLISVRNNGKGLPIEWHSDEKCYVPTLVFGQLLTGSNFDDDEKKTTGGRNGVALEQHSLFDVLGKLCLYKATSWGDGSLRMC